MFDLRRIAVGLALLVSCGAADLPARASGETVEAVIEQPSKDWSIEFTPYLWAVNMNLQLAGGPIDNTVGLNTTELLKNISGYASAEMKVRYKRVGVFGDGMWARLKVSETRQILTDTFEVKLQSDMAFGTGAAFYEFRPTEQLSLSPYVGARWWRVNNQLGIVDTAGVIPPESGDVITRWADPVFGLLVNYDITDKVLAKTAGDVGGGVSKVSWQAMLGAEYAMTDWFALDVMYRVMGVNYQPDDDKIKLSLNGILFGFKFRY